MSDSNRMLSNEVQLGSGESTMTEKAQQLENIQQFTVGNIWASAIELKHSKFTKTNQENPKRLLKDTD